MEKEVVDSYKEAGRIAAQAREYGRKLIKVDAKLVDVCDAIDEFIIKKKAFPAFPSQISMNTIAAHYCPDIDDISVFKTGDVVKLDVGVHVEGYVGDTAVTVDLGNHDDLVNASREALDAALKIVGPGVSLSEIGTVIHREIQKYGLSPIKNLSGHGLDQFQIHSSPSIPNFNTGDKTTLKIDTAIAIEPFATNGAGSIFESSNATIFSQTAHKQVRSPFAREVLKEIENYNDLPFAKRWLSKKFGAGKTSFALKELIKFGVIQEHPPLPEKGHGLVSQAEHTVLILEKPFITTRIEE
jgi:methionyl aminopeptidase